MGTGAMRTNANYETVFAEGTALLRPTDASEACGEAIEIAFVNNMPDQAAMTSQVQFTQILRAGAGEVPFRLRCYTLPGVPRNVEMRQHLLQTHEDIDALMWRGADALIVTGTEPRAALLTDEPYWAEFTRLVEWARDNTLSTIWSCLAAHAVVQHLDGIPRHRAVDKVSGVYSFKTRIDDWSMRDSGPWTLVPHSRYNGIVSDDLERCGYTISSWSESSGVDTFWRREPSLFLFLQGHPEYHADTLAREYRRDVIRFLTGGNGTYPHIPKNYFSQGAQAHLKTVRVRALTLGRSGCEEAINETLSNETLESRWAPDAARLYRNWLAIVALEKRRKTMQGAAK
jgi:homoserine O-succinyltransferase